MVVLFAEIESSMTCPRPLGALMMTVMSFALEVKSLPLVPEAKFLGHNVQDWKQARKQISDISGVDKLLESVFSDAINFSVMYTVTDVITVLKSYFAHKLSNSKLQSWHDRLSPWPPCHIWLCLVHSGY